MNKNYEVTASPFGFGPTAGPSQALALGIFLTRNSLVLIKLSMGNSGMSCGGTLSCGGNSRALSIYYKKFISNSFYFSTGIDQRQANYYEQSTDPFSANYNYSFDSDSTNFGFAIGNQWQWSHFTFGCDYIGLSTPVMTQIKNEIANTPDSYSQSGLAGAKNRYVTSNAVQSLRLYLGASF